MTEETIEQITTEEEQLLELLEADSELTDEQKDGLLGNKQLADDYLLARHAIAMLGERPLDIEGRLERMKRQRSRKTQGRRIARLSPIWGLGGLAVAAAVACLLLFLPTAKVETSGHTDENHVFVADKVASNITLTADEDKKTLAEVKKGNTVVDTEIDVNALLAECEADERVTLQVPTGKSAHLTLPDGSQVWLYPGSRLKFPQRFVGDTREVMLEGQAYFSVQRDPSHPFVVSAADVTTTVLGTEFVVSAYEDTTPQITLVSGSVQIAKGNSRVLLSPGRQAMPTADGSFDITEVDTEPYVQWRDGYFYFDNATLHDILVAIGRSYNVCVVCQHPESLTKHMRFIADRSEPLESIIDRLNAIVDKKVTLNGNTLEVDI
ncbi:MAG: FecR family protein [Prevotella sp.]